MYHSVMALWSGVCDAQPLRLTIPLWPGVAQGKLELNLAHAAELKAGIPGFLHRPYTLLGKKNQSLGRQITKMPDH